MSLLLDFVAPPRLRVARSAAQRAATVDIGTQLALPRRSNSVRSLEDFYRVSTAFAHLFARLADSILVDP
jgi:hypothetical protein